MNQYIALRLRKLPSIYWIVKPDIEISPPQDFIVNTQHGCEVARVLRLTDRLPESTALEAEPFITEILRPVGPEEEAKIEEIKQKEHNTFLKARERIEQHQLSMKLLKAEYLFDYSRLILYFKSENKVDFRELLKTLATAFKTRIELRQIGVRDETKLLGGLGCCGKVVCCSHFMTTFYPVSTKMAKEQNLSLNPVKLSGICGRLLCCLNHEQEYYASFHGKFPKLAAEIVIGDGTAKVMDINYITRKIIIGFQDRRKAVFSLDDVHGRKDSTTGRNLWWIAAEGEPEPDLNILLKNLNPPGTGKKKKKNTSSDEENRETDSDSTKKNASIKNNDSRNDYKEKKDKNKEKSEK